MDRRTRRLLLMPGWPGALDEAEFGYVVSTLRRDVKRRQLWGVNFSRPGWEAAVRFIAMHGAPDNPEANRRMARRQLPPVRKIETARQIAMPLGRAR